MKMTGTWGIRQEKTERQEGGLSREALKMTAMLTMALNHFAQLFLSYDTLLFFTLINIGYFTAPLMCWFVADGYHYTRSVRKYACRLLAFGLMSQLPYMLYEGKGELVFQNLNMMFTLLISLMITVVWYEILDDSLKFILIALLVSVSYFTDWQFMGPVFTVIYLMFGGKKGGKVRAAGVMTGFYLVMALIQSRWIWLAYGAGFYLYHVLLGTAAVAAAGFSFACLYHGRRASKGRIFFKWFFYLFYPVHLLILDLVKMYLFST